MKVRFVSDLLLPERCNTEFTFPATLLLDGGKGQKKKKRTKIKTFYKFFSFFGKMCVFCLALIIYLEFYSSL